MDDDRGRVLMILFLIVFFGTILWHMLWYGWGVSGLMDRIIELVVH